MLLGRGAECERIDELIARARVGESGVLMLWGEAGIGKTALLDYARERAEHFQVLECRGIESESELAFCSLGDLFSPVLGRLSSIPEPQAGALAGALAIGPPARADPFAICAATLSLLAAAAEESRLLVLVDDAHWLDESTTRALLFAARRLDAEEIAFLFAARRKHGSLLEAAQLPELTLSGLEEQVAKELIQSRIAAPVAAAVVEQLWRTTGGNPLALIEVPTLLSDAQLGGAESLEELPSAPLVDRALLRYVDALPRESQRALLVAAASDTHDLEAIAEALRLLGLDPGSLDAAEDAGLLSVDGERLEYRHPLLRSAVYRAAPGIARRRAHQALAEATVADRTDRRAWHLAAAAAAQDEYAAAALERAAVAARGRGGHAEAASALERAALLSGDERERARLLREAARDAWLVGRIDKVFELLDAALAHGPDPALRARIQQLRGTVEMWRGSPATAHELLVEEAGAVAASDPSWAARLLTDASWACYMAAEIDAGLAAARRAVETAGAAGAAQTRAKGALGIGLMLSGEAPSAVPLFEAYLNLTEEARRHPGLYQPFRPDGQVLTWFEQYDQARDVLLRTTDNARASSALSVLPYALAAQSDLDYRTGRWAAAYANGFEAARFAAETDQATTLAFSLACLARVEAAQGREDDARAHAAKALEIAYPRVGAVVAYASAALGLLELGLGRNDEAIAHLRELRRRVSEHGLREPAVVQWAPDLIEAYIRAGRRDEAEEALAEFSALADKTQRTWALATAARCRGLLAPDEQFESEFQRAVELHETTPTPFELARTQLCLGERLRRGRRRADARGSLRSALDTLDRLGAAPWSARARAELAATGETVGARDRYAAEQLTPQELQIALVVGRGATNKEAGAALFLSPKTIETHLGHIYRKLDVRSRTDLARLLASEGALASVAG